MTDSARPLTFATASAPARHAPSSAIALLERELELRVLVVYSDSALRRRVRDALVQVLANNSEEAPAFPDIADRLRSLDDGVALRVGPIEVSFHRPPGAERFLVERRDRRAIEEWTESWLPAPSAPIRLAVMLQTNVDAKDDRKNKDELADPKQVLRRYLAQRGIATQFIASTSGPDDRAGRRAGDQERFREHAAANALTDLLRSAGLFPRPFPEAGCGVGTLVVGVYGARLTRITTRARTSYVANVVAVSLGTHDAWGFIDGAGWVPLQQATTSFLASDHQQSDREAKALVERAIDALYPRFGDRPTILLFDAIGCRRFWPCLADKSEGEPEVWMTRHGKAVVRARAGTTEILRPAGVGEWTRAPSPARHTDFRLTTLDGADGRAAAYVISGSAVMSRERSARASTRFAADPRTLKKDWHSLGVTELLVLQPGGWESERLVGQVATLCREGPTWSGTLRWPSPLHLARAIVRDHPHGFFNEHEDDDEGT